jgi:hypothetical protein
VVNVEEISPQAREIVARERAEILHGQIRYSALFAVAGEFAQVVEKGRRILVAFIDLIPKRARSTRFQIGQSETYS